MANAAAAKKTAALEILAVRIETERRVARRVVASAIAKGYSVAVTNSAGEAQKPSDLMKAVVDFMFATDEEVLTFHKGGRSVGFAALAYGQGAGGVLVRSTDNEAVREILISPLELADSLV